MKRGLLLGALLAAALRLYALDYGITLHQTVELSGAEGGNPELSYTPGLGPWLSEASGKTVDFYLSAFANTRYDAGAWRFVPELGRLSLLYRPLSGLGLELGRIRHSDPNNLVVSGLFDGLMGTFDLGNTRLSLGTFYSGFLYRDTAKIFMTAADSSWNYGAAGDMVFSFAGRRLISTAGWEVPSLFGSPHGLVVDILTQFDLNAAAEKLDSQYCSLRFNFSPLPSVYARLGTVIGFAEYRTAGDTEGQINLALSAGLDWAFPGAAEDGASFGVVWASGGIDNAFLGPFRPDTMFSSSGVLSAGLAGLGTLRGSYTVRLLENLSLDLDCRYFFRGNLETFDTLPLTLDQGKRALGGELYWCVIWVPVSDISVVWGAGLFFPGLGNAVQGAAPPRWKSMLTLTFSM